jgi:molybdate transport system substrate-binding protein
MRCFPIKKWRLILCWLLTLLSAEKAFAKPLHIAVATNFLVPMQQIVEVYKRQTQHDVILSAASSGKLYAQILQGAPFDLFFSADQHKPAALQKKGLIVAGSRQTYVLGRLVLFTTETSLNLHTGQVLQDKFTGRLAMANPRIAPYGEAAKQVLEHLQVTLKPEQLIVGENVAQAYQFVSSGHAQLGLVALSLIFSQQRPPHAVGLSSQQHWLIPPSWHAPIYQDMVWLKHAAGNPQAEAFYEFVSSDKARQIMQDFGYALPDSD